MKINFDYHTHTTYSHGKASILDNAISAKEKGLNGIAITDHGFSHVIFGMKRNKVAKMRAECEKASNQTGVKVLLGIEANINGEAGATCLKPSDYENLDVFLCGIHRGVMHQTLNDIKKLLFDNFRYVHSKREVPKSLIDYNTRVYINAIKNNPIDVLTHLNYLVFADAKQVAQCCADYGTYLEISTKKIHLTPKEWQDVFDTKVNFVINSDAHSPDRIGDIALFEELKKQIDFPMDRIHNVGDKHPNLRFTEFKKHL